MMESENKKGQKIVLGIGIVTVLFSLLIIIVNNIVVGPGDVAQQVIRLIIWMALGYALYVGVNWARWVWIILSTLGGLVSLFGGVIMLISLPVVGILTIFMGTVYLISPALLFFTPDVKEHFGERNYKLP